MKDELKKKAIQIAELEILNQKGIYIENDLNEIINSLSFEELIEVDNYITENNLLTN